jgi:hypothetical protein
MDYETLYRTYVETRDPHFMHRSITVFALAHAGLGDIESRVADFAGTGQLARHYATQVRAYITKIKAGEMIPHFLPGPAPGTPNYLREMP